MDIIFHDDDIKKVKELPNGRLAIYIDVNSLVENEESFIMFSEPEVRAMLALFPQKKPETK